jgi:hypothetical protein
MFSGKMKSSNALDSTERVIAVVAVLVGLPALRIKKRKTKTFVLKSQHGLFHSEFTMGLTPNIGDVFQTYMTGGNAVTPLSAIGGRAVERAQID